MTDDLNSSDDCASNTRMNEVCAAEPTLCSEEDTVQYDAFNGRPLVEILELQIDRANKRDRDKDDEEQWILVERDGKRLKGKFEVTVSSVEKLPKQFALAKLLHTHQITNITRVKYVSPYKVLFYFEDDKSAERLITCEELQKLGWRCHKPLEVSVSYGIIRDVELDLNEKIILETIKSSYKLLAVKRLKRRNADGTGWIESETVRLAFKGPTLPSSIKIHGIAVRVDPYVFPVTQCSRCWRFGHSLRACPTLKIVCPKCTKNHANCEVTTFTCINCGGNHHALDRICQAYRKEKIIRDKMAQFNCAYRKASMMYVPPTFNLESKNSAPVTRQDPTLPEPQGPSPPFVPAEMSYASALKKPSAPTNYNEIAGTSAGIYTEEVLPNLALPQRSLQNSKTKRKRNKHRYITEDIDMSDQSSDAIRENKTTGLSETRDKTNEEKRRTRISGLTFKQLLDKLKSIIFSDEYEDIKAKFKHGISLFMEWMTTSVIQYLCDLPFKFNLI